MVKSHLSLARNRKKVDPSNAEKIDDTAMKCIAKDFMNTFFGKWLKRIDDDRTVYFKPTKQQYKDGQLFIGVYFEVSATSRYRIVCVPNHSFMRYQLDPFEITDDNVYEILEKFIAPLWDATDENRTMKCIDGDNARVVFGLKGDNESCHLINVAYDSPDRHPTEVIVSNGMEAKYGMMGLEHCAETERDLWALRVQDTIKSFLDTKPNEENK